MSFLTLEDLGLLREKGFKAGPTGHAWYGMDSFGDVWRAFVEDTGERMMFSVETGQVWGPSSYMKREDFDEQFKRAA